MIKAVIVSKQYELCHLRKQPGTKPCEQLEQGLLRGSSTEPDKGLVALYQGRIRSCHSSVRDKFQALLLLCLPREVGEFPSLLCFRRSVLPLGQLRQILANSVSGKLPLVGAVSTC